MACPDGDTRQPPHRSRQAKQPSSGAPNCTTCPTRHLAPGINAGSSNPTTKDLLISTTRSCQAATRHGRSPLLSRQTSGTTLRALLWTCRGQADPVLVPVVRNPATAQGQAHCSLADRLLNHPISAWAPMRMSWVRSPDTCRMRSMQPIQPV